jgi:hypothetical protein
MAAKPASLVLMPEAAMHEQCRASAGEDQVGRAWQVGAMEPKPQASSVCCAAHSKLWLCIDLSNAAHVSAALSGRKTIKQYSLQQSADYTVLGLQLTK